MSGSKRRKNREERMRLRQQVRSRDQPIYDRLLEAVGSQDLAGIDAALAQAGARSRHIACRGNSEALRRAALFGNTAAVDRLLPHSDLASAGHGLFVALAQQGSPTMIAHLLPHAPERADHAAFQAVLAGRPECVRAVLSAVVNPRLRNGSSSCLRQAARQRRPDLVALVAPHSSPRVAWRQLVLDARFHPEQGQDVAQALRFLLPWLPAQTQQELLVVSTSAIERSVLADAALARTLSGSLPLVPTRLPCPRL